MSEELSINGKRLHECLKTLGSIGRDENGRLSRVALSENDKKGRDTVVGWMQDLGLRIEIDNIGNIFGIWETEENKNESPVMIGSHIDTVVNAGIYDGCYGVLSGIEVIKTLKEDNYKTSRPIVVGAFTNEEGVRYAPDMMGSLVYSGGLSVEEALKIIGTDGSILGEELEKIGYSGTVKPGFIKPYAYIELHIEQGPILDSENISIGAVENLQGISWQNISIEGVANHAGTTPTNMRKDAALGAAKVINYLRERCDDSGGTTVATVGCMEFEPNVINVIPSLAKFTVDLRDPNEETLKDEEFALDQFLMELSESDDLIVNSERLVRFKPVEFDEQIVKLIEKAAETRTLSYRRMTSGAGHDAQMMSRICPTAMIFVPSIDGISHNPSELTLEENLTMGGNVLLDVILGLSS